MNNGTVFSHYIPFEKWGWYEKAVCGIVASLGYSLKLEQKISIWKFLSGNDVYFIANRIWDILVSHHVAFVL